MFMFKHQQQITENSNLSIIETHERLFPTPHITESKTLSLSTRESQGQQVFEFLKYSDFLQSYSAFFIKVYSRPGFFIPYSSFTCENYKENSLISFLV